MNIQDFISNRAGDYTRIRQDQEYKKCTETLSSLYRFIEDKLNGEGEQIVEEIKSLNSILNGISNSFLYKRGLRDGIKLGELFAEIQTIRKN